MPTLPPFADKSKMLTTNEAAAWADLSPRYLSRLIRQGRLQAEKFGPVWIVRAGAIEAYMASDRKPGPRKPSRLAS